MKRSNITAQGYYELADDDSQPSYLQEEFRRLAEKAAKREAMLATINANALRDRLTGRWQQETLRKLRWLYGYQYEVSAWSATAPAPIWIAEAECKVGREMRGIRQRLLRARREANAGDAMQARWLADHAALINALELKAAYKAPRES